MQLIAIKMRLIVDLQFPNLEQSFHVNLFDFVAIHIPNSLAHKLSATIFRLAHTSINGSLESLSILLS